MNKDLTHSSLHRQNVLNNHFAIQEIEKEFNFEGVILNGETIFTKRQVSTLLEIDERTIERYLISHGPELRKNGYQLLTGKLLKELKSLSLSDIDVAQSTKSLSVFSFRSILNLAMLLTESDRAKKIRSRILDIVIDVITQKTGGTTTYINQRDADYLPAAFQEESYRKILTDALRNYVLISDQWEYGHYTNLIYKAIFEENAKEYRKILNLSEKDKVRDTLYVEVIDLIAAFESGFSENLEQEYKKIQRKLKRSEATNLFEQFSKQALFKPLINKAKTLMASRDLCFRDALHEKLKLYIQSVPEGDYERFLGERSQALEIRIGESLDVYKRLKDR